MKVPYAPAKRGAPKWRWRLILAIVFSPAIYLVFTAVRQMLTLSADGAVAFEQYELRAPAAGQVAQLAVQAGASISKGDIIVRLQDPALDAAIADIRARLSNAKHATPGAQNEVRAELDLQNRILQAAQQRVADVQDLLSQGAATRGELREAQIAADQAAAAVLRVRQQLVAPPSGEASSAAERELNRLLSAREQLTIRAPVDGRVLETEVTQNEFVAAGTSLLILAGSQEPEIVAYVAPEISARLRAGARATVRFPDGTKTQATVIDRPRITRRMPPELVDQFGGRPMTIELRLQAHEPWPPAERIHGLPVKVRFHYGWEPAPGDFRSATR
jgi:multidrug resistance efflux pump